MTIDRDPAVILVMEGEPMRLVVLKLMCFLCTSVSIPAQTPEQSWDNLRQLRPGQRIEVVNMKLKPLQGEFAACSDDAILLRTGRSEATIARDEVLSVKLRSPSRRLRNTLLGLGIGAAAGVALGAIHGATYHEAGETPVFMMVYTPIGAGIGTGIGAAIPRSQVTIYRAPKPLPGPAR